MDGVVRLQRMLFAIGILTGVMACQKLNPTHTPRAVGRQFVATPLDFQGMQVASSCGKDGEITEEATQAINREYLATLVELGPESDMQVSLSPQPGSIVVSTQVTQIDPGCNPGVQTRVMIRDATGTELDRFELSSRVISWPALMVAPAPNRMGKALAEDLLQRLKGN